MGEGERQRQGGEISRAGSKPMLQHEGTHGNKEKNRASPLLPPLCMAPCAWIRDDQSVSGQWVGRERERE
jgi:hypothetical protein